MVLWFLIKKKLTSDPLKIHRRLEIDCFFFFMLTSTEIG
jgi:hypothetical protein